MSTVFYYIPVGKLLGPRSLSFHAERAASGAGRRPAGTAASLSHHVWRTGGRDGNYEEQRRDEILAAATMSLTGVLLDPPDSARADFMAGHRAFVQCRCHEDPCACDGPIVWVKWAAVEAETLTARSNRAGSS